MNDTTLIQIVIIGYAIAAFTYIYWFNRLSETLWPGRILLTGFILHTAALVWRWILSYQMGYGHAPVTNRYESLVFFSWSVVAVYLLMNRWMPIVKMGAVAGLLGAVGLASTALIPGAESEVMPLMPALKSNWLFYHVMTCFLGYAAFAIACFAGVYSLLLHRNNKADSIAIRQLDEIMHRSVVTGFLLLSLGIITGSAWAYNAWGRYWGWDPKEVWSLITWLVYAVFLHARITRGWNGRQLAWIAIAGFIAVLFTFLGVNYLPIFKGLHSYA